MNLFPDGAFVRLRSRVRHTYVHADEDAAWVSVRPLGAVPSLNAVWRVQHCRKPQVGGYLLLQGAAYGRYLGVSLDDGDDDDPLPGHRGRRAVHRDLDELRLMPNFMWSPVRVHHGHGYVRLCNYFSRCLRANGRHRFWNTGVTADFNEFSTMVHWKVEAVPLSPAPPLLPLPSKPPIHVRRGLFWWLTRSKVYPDKPRTIRHVRANDELDFYLNHEDWPEFDFYDHSVFNLRTEVALHQNDGNIFGITLCVKPGMYGRLTPLVTNLPRSQEPMNIVVFTTGSPAAERLVYPDI